MSNLEAIKEAIRNVITLEEKLAEANARVDALIGPGSAPAVAAATLNGHAKPTRARRAKPDKAPKRAAKKKKAGKPGRKASPDSNASKILAIMKDQSDVSFTIEALLGITGLQKKQVQSAVGQLRAKGGVSTPERGHYRYAASAG